MLDQPHSVHPRRDEIEAPRLYFARRAPPSQTQRGMIMKSLAIRAALLAGIGTVAMTLPAASTPSSDRTDARQAKPAAVHYAASPYDCYTDDGYGRKRSCSASFKKKNKKKAE
jgi:hypothetical protein